MGNQINHVLGVYCNLTSNLPKSTLNLHNYSELRHQANFCFWKIAPTASFWVLSRCRAHLHQFKQCDFNVGNLSMDLFSILRKLCLKRYFLKQVQWKETWKKSFMEHLPKTNFRNVFSLNAKPNKNRRRFCCLYSNYGKTFSIKSLPNFAQYRIFMIICDRSRTLKALLNFP